MRAGEGVMVHQEPYRYAWPASSERQHFGSNEMRRRAKSIRPQHIHVDAPNNVLCLVRRQDLILKSNWIQFARMGSFNFRNDFHLVCESHLFHSLDCDLHTRNARAKGQKTKKTKISDATKMHDKWNGNLRFLDDVQYGILFHGDGRSWAVRHWNDLRFTKKKHYRSRSTTVSPHAQCPVQIVAIITSVAHTHHVLPKTRSLSPIFWRSCCKTLWISRLACGRDALRDKEYTGTRGIDQIDGIGWRWVGAENLNKYLDASHTKSEIAKIKKTIFSLKIKFCLLSSHQWQFPQSKYPERCVEMQLTITNRQPNRKRMIE